MPETELIMVFEHDPQPPFQVIEIPHGDSLSHQSRHAVSPFVVQAFDPAGLATAFIARPVLPGPEQFGIRLIKVRVDQLPAIVSRQTKAD